MRQVTCFVVLAVRAGHCSSQRASLGAGAGHNQGGGCYELDQEDTHDGHHGGDEAGLGPDEG